MQHYAIQHHVRVQSGAPLPRDTAMQWQATNACIPEHRWAGSAGLTLPPNLHTALTTTVGGEGPFEGVQSPWLDVIAGFGAK